MLEGWKAGMLKNQSRNLFKPPGFHASQLSSLSPLSFVLLPYLNPINE
jgi:hypothetical protein